MKKLIFIAALLISSGSFAQSFKMSKERLVSVQQKFASSQKLCRERESDVANDPFILNLDSLMDEGVKEGEISLKTSERVKKMVLLVIKLSEDLCEQIDSAVTLIDKEIKSEEATSVFSLLDIEKAMLDTAEEAVQEILDLAMAPELPQKEQELLKVIGDVMQRAADKIAEQKAADQTKN